MKKQNKQRRGILLLVVLSLLSLFVLIGVTFIVVSGQYRRASVSGTKVERVGESPTSLLDAALLEVLNPRPGSPIDGQGILEDFYGREGMSGTIDANPVKIVDGQFFQFETEYTDTSGPFEPPVSWNYPGFFNGSVLTYTSGKYEGTSVRVVSYDYKQMPAPDDDKFTAQFVVENEGYVEGKGLPSVDDSFVVNGRPFNGTGHGYDTVAETLSLNYTTDSLKAISEVFRVNGGVIGLNGGADESYDAPDFQNLFLGWQADNPSDGTTIIPSFHRPAVLKYVFETKYTSNVDEFVSDETGNLISYRPLAFENPNFSGSNPSLNAQDGTEFPEFDQNSSQSQMARIDYLNRLVTGVSPSGQTTWDVDNDGDGVPDSVWIDLGIPATVDGNGQQYKPLFAIRCIDLDGKINVNTAGIYDDATGSGADATSSAAGGGTEFSTPGLGYGPADVYLPSVLNVSQDEQSFIKLRYADAQGSEELPGNSGADFYDVPAFQQQDTNFDLFGSYADLLGRTSLVIDHFGQPFLNGYVESTSEGTVNFDIMATNTPYEANLNFKNGRDSAFSEVDLERVLRRFDYDSVSLPSRLVDDTTTPVSLRVLPEAITTRSFDVPVINAVPNTSQRGIGESLSPVDLLSSGLDGDPSEVLPFEMRYGQKMNLNRPFGDGADSNGNEIADEPDELFMVQSPSTRQDGMEYLNDDPIFNGVAKPQRVQAPVRQLYARNIYSLLRIINANNFIQDRDGKQSAERTARILAQWAVNVVDFMDSDSIMTPFEYDIDITDGWDADGDLTAVNAGCGIVWGCERPELLITETLATHDVRTEDRDDDNGVMSNIANGDPDLDQRFRPQGSLFVELFNPWSSQYLKTPPELYDASGTGVDLTKKVSSSNAALSPVVRTSAVWRLFLSNQVPPSRNAVLRDPIGVSTVIYDPDHPNFSATTNSQSLMEVADLRYVYFVNSTTYSDASFRPKASPTEVDYYSSLHASPVVVPKGGYAVAGSAGIKRMNALGSTVYTTTMGFNAGLDVSMPLTTIDYDMTRRIEMNLNAGHQVRVLRNGSTTPMGEVTNPVPDQPMLASIRPCNAFIVNRSSQDAEAGLSVSEPLKGYDPTSSLSPDISERVFPNVFDTPLDEVLLTALGQDDQSDPEDPPVIGGGAAPLAAANSVDEGVITNFRVVYLQRLANPLLAWNPLPGQKGHDPERFVNPYRTIDSAPIDLTIFNGFGQAQNPAPALNFHSRQRGDFLSLKHIVDYNSPDAEDPDVALVRRKFWASEPSYAGATIVSIAKLPSVSESSSSTKFSVNTPTNSHHFGYLLRTSLGHLNHAYQPIDPSLSGTHPGAPQIAVNDAMPRKEQPAFPWLNWQNRPFASVMELLQVPVSSSFHLGNDYSSSSDISTTAATITPYGERPIGVAPFGHLMNFFADAEGLHQLFEYVEVPSPYLGTRTWYNETAMTTAVNDGTAPVGLQPPFHSLSKFRIPGLVNINTVTSSSWAAIEESLENPPSYDELETSRRASTVIKSNGTLDAALPSQFANPFRSPNAYDLVPPSLVASSAQDGLNAGLLRANGATGGTSPLFSVDSKQAHFDARSNPAIRFSDLQRVSSMVTNHSNVYAIWITMGNFEYDETDGFGREIGEDTGNIARHRAFYIIDRSVPVAFEPGVRHNEDNTVVLRRILE